MPAALFGGSPQSIDLTVDRLFLVLPVRRDAGVGRHQPQRAQRWGAGSLAAAGTAGPIRPLVPGRLERYDWSRSRACHTRCLASRHRTVPPRWRPAGRRPRRRRTGRVCSWMACAASLRVAARGGPTVHGSARPSRIRALPFAASTFSGPVSPSPRDGLDDLEAQAAFDCNHSSSVTITRGGRPLPLQQLPQQAFGRLLVPPALNQHVEHDAVLVDRPPQPVLLAGDLDLDLVQVPLVAGPRQPRRSRSRSPGRTSSAHCRMVSWLTVTPRAASISSTIRSEQEAEVEPHGVADDLRREPVAGVGGLGRRRHARPVAGSPPACNLPRANLTVPPRALPRFLGA